MDVVLKVLYVSMVSRFLDLFMRHTGARQLPSGSVRCFWVVQILRTAMCCLMDSQ